MIERLVAVFLGALKTHRPPSLAPLWLVVAAVLLFLLGGLYLSLSVYLALADQLGPPVAAVLTGGLLLVAATLAVLVALLLSRPPRRKPGEDEATDIAEVLVRVGEIFGHKIERPGSSLAIAALLAGIVAGVSPAARGFLLNLAQQLFKEMRGEPK
jgi:hypothetical protein